MPDLNLTLASGRGAGQILGARAEQQDALAFGELVLGDERRATLAILADGMGGHEGGALAAQVAVAAFGQRCAAGRDRSFSETLQAALLAANRAIAEETASQPSLRDMGCTLLAAAVDSSTIHYISVGDSIAWLVREGSLERLNADHSMAPLIDEALARGEITEEQAQFQRSGLRSALTGRTIPLIDARSIELRADDALLLASDGILTLSPAQITAVIAEVGEHGPPILVDRLLDEVERHAPSDQDNCSLIWLAPSSTPAAAPPRRQLLSPARCALIGGLALAAIGAGQLIHSGVLGHAKILDALTAEDALPAQPSAESGRHNDTSVPTGLRQGEEYPKGKRPSGTTGGTKSKASAAFPVDPKTPATKADEPGKSAGKPDGGKAEPATSPTTGANANADIKRQDKPNTQGSAAPPRLVPDPAVIDEAAQSDTPGP